MLSAKPSMNLRLEKKKNNKNQRKNMNNQFDELTKGLAQSVTRRAALKKFGVGLAGMALACFGLANKAEADPRPPTCEGCITSCVGFFGQRKESCRKLCSSMGAC